jgi:DNA modification methylase
MENTMKATNPNSQPLTEGEEHALGGKSHSLPAGYWAPISSLKKWIKNPRKNDKAVPEVARSVRHYGFVAPVVVWKSEQRLVAGHTRIAALELILSKDPAFVPRDAPGVGLVPVRFHEFTDETEANAYALADNKLTEIAEWDEALLGEVLAEIQKLDEKLLAETGFADAETERLIAASLGDEVVGEDAGAEEPPAEPVSKPGEVYVLGAHRLMCGDSTNAEHVRHLMNGQVATLLSTDPPYCVDYTGMDRPVHDGKPSGKDWSHVYREVDIKDLGVFLNGVFTAVLPHVKDDAAMYIWHAHLQQPVIAQTFEKHGLLLHQILVWVKPVATFGHSYYRWRHEPCAFGWKKGNKPVHGFGQEDSVWEIDWEGKARVVGNEHPTQKPLEIFRKPIRIHTKRADLVLEPFGGSGSQLIAAAMEGRRCYAMELSPAFCDVIRRRWTKYARSAGVEPGPGALE